MYHFFLIILDEPGLTSLGGYPDGLSQENIDRYRSFLEEGVSVIAIDKTNDIICGAMLSMMFTRYVLKPIFLKKPRFLFFVIIFS